MISCDVYFYLLYIYFREFLSTQSELKELRSSQHSKRVDRDKLIKDIVRIRKQEDETRVNITAKKELDSTLNTGMYLAQSSAKIL